MLCVGTTLNVHPGVQRPGSHPDDIIDFWKALMKGLVYESQLYFIDTKMVDWVVISQDSNLPAVTYGKLSQG